MANRDAAMDALAGPVARLKAAGVTAEAEVGVGDAKDVIVERASENDVALVVMASHGRIVPCYEARPPGTIPSLRARAGAGRKDHHSAST